MPDYGTWIRGRAIAVFAALTVVCAGAAAAPIGWAWRIPALLAAAAFGWIWLIVGLTRRRLSARGGAYQRKIHRLLVDRARGQDVLDVGCGNGHLTIQLALADVSRRVTGIDYWGAQWEYSHRTCEANAALEGVADRTPFLKASASALPFDDASFDGVASCLVFHEVRDVDDKTLALAEALRVLRPGGRFVFVDLFDDPRHFPDRELLDRRIRDARCVVGEDRHLGELLPLPFPLAHGKVLGFARLLSGDKRPGAAS